MFTTFLITVVIIMLALVVVLFLAVIQLKARLGIAEADAEAGRQTTIRILQRHTQYRRGYSYRPELDSEED